MIADQEQTWERLMEATVAELRQLWEGLDEKESGQALELAVRDWQRRVGREVMQTLCQEAIRRRDQAQIELCCGRRMDNHSRPRRTVKTLLGDVRVRRRWHRCLSCGSRRFPADRWLGWEGGFSHAVQELVAWESSGLPFEEAVASLDKLAGLSVSKHAAEDIARRWGKEELELAPNAERVGKDLVIEIDGAKAHLEEGWKEIKVGTCFSWDGTDPEAKPEAVSYCADWETAEQFRETLWQETVVRGVSGARAMAVIGDGAPWIWDLASHLYPYATQILDWYHLTEHLGAAAKVVHGERTPETTALVEQWKTEMWEGRSEGVEQHLRELVAAGQDDSDHTLRKCADYLQTNQARVRYHLFRAAGWPIGSGVVEGACKHVIGLRFKRQSTRWSRAGARAVLHLRLDRLSGRWQARCNHMRKAA